MRLLCYGYYSTGIKIAMSFRKYIPFFFRYFIHCKLNYKCICKIY